MRRDLNARRITVADVAEAWAALLLTGRLTCLDDVVLRLGVSGELAARGLEALLDAGAFPEKLGGECFVLHRTDLRLEDVTLRDIVELRLLPQEQLNILEVSTIYSQPVADRLHDRSRRQPMTSRRRRRNAAATARLKRTLTAF